MAAKEKTTKKAAPKAQTKVAAPKAAKPSDEKILKQKQDDKNTEKTTPEKKATRTNALSVPVYTLDGVSGGNLDLPKDIFGVEINKQLLAQAVRVYNNNLKGHHSNTKTRGEVEGSTKKIFRQKGTGHARHGGIRAPIFVGGGIALGPKARKVTLDLPKKMKKAALLSALSQKAVDNAVFGVSGFEKLTGKTKEMAQLAKRMSTGGKNKTLLFVTDQKNEMANRASRNIPGMNMVTVDQLNVFEIVKHQNLVVTKEAVEKLTARVKGEK